MIRLFVVSITSLALLTGCANMTTQQRNIVTGGAVGGAVGTGVGLAVGTTAAVASGAGIGILAGGLIGAALTDRNGSACATQNVPPAPTAYRTVEK